MTRAEILKSTWFQDLIRESFMAGVDDGYIRGTKFSRCDNPEESATIYLAKVVARESEAEG